MVLGEKIEEADFADKIPLLQSLSNLFCQDKSGEMVCCEKGKNDNVQWRTTQIALLDVYEVN